MMNVVAAALREYSLWRKYPTDRLHWLLQERRNPLSSGTFKLDDTTYKYFVHPYNHTWANERVVEIPVVLEFLRTSDSAHVLEVGNVLSHYVDLEHLVVDLKEKCWYRRVINRDITEFVPQREFTHIVSISTMEHIGWDERPKQPQEVLLAFCRLTSMLRPGGKALITIPVGYNPFLDNCLREGTLSGYDVRCLKRISQANEWVEVGIKEGLGCRYGSPFGNANAVAFLSLSGA